jgi:hypothetical protein
MAVGRPAHRKKKAPPEVRATKAKPKRRAAPKKPPVSSPAGARRDKGDRAAVKRPLPVASPYPWTVTEELVRHLTDVQLRNLMRDLSIDEAYRSGADVAKVIINAEVKAPDDGADALTPRGMTSHTWLSDTHTCWQLKAGSAGQAAKLKGEVRKPIAAMTLRSGGRFVLVASGAGDGKKGMAARQKALVGDARRAGLPAARIEVMTSEALTTWINEHPALAAQLRGMPPGFSSLETWAKQPPYRDAWVSSPALDAKLERLRREVDFESANPTVHLHVFGRPGVGKTRFVLQACQHARWSKSVLYVPQWAEARISEMLAAVSQAGAGRLVLVVDEVPPEQVKSLAFHVAAAADRIRVITIGHHASPDGQTIAQIEVEALDDETMTRLIQAAHPAMPAEHVRYVVSFADGYTRLARLAANAVATNPDVHTADLLHHHGDIEQLMDSMLGSDDRRPLHVLAILSSVGWTGPRAEEGKAIAAHFGLDWMHVQASVERFHRKFGIAPRANDLRYISPAPLGVYLALDAVQSYPEQVRSLPDKLPNEQARHAYNERLEAILANPRARTFGEEELARFFHWSHFLDANAVDRWVTLSMANPVLAAGNAREALQQATDEERRQIEGGARRGLVRGLVRLASYADAFHDAALALAELAAAENEIWANNATGEFIARYQLFLGGTACPYLDRLTVLDELLASGRPPLQALAVRALARAGVGHEVGMLDSSPATGPAPVQWRPASGQDHHACVRAALERLERAAALPVPEQALIDAAKQLAMLLRHSSTRQAIAAFLRAAAAHHPAIREHVRREVHDIAQHSRRLWKDLEEPEVEWIEALEAELSDRTLGGQLRELVGHPEWGRTEESLRPLAEELVKEPAVLWSEWPWLTGGDATGAWDLGVALEKVDAQHELLPELVTAAGTGSDLRVVAGYVRSYAQTMPAGWIDDWLDELEHSATASPLLIFELTWRLADTSGGARRLTRMARAGQLPPNAVAHLAFGPWVLGPALPELRELLETLIVEPEHRIHLLHMIDNRLKKHPQDVQGLRALALAVVADPSVLLADSMSQYHWDQLARALLPQHTREIARTIFAAQARPGGVSFFLEHSMAAGTLDACIEANAAEVWEELAVHLGQGGRSELFIIGFPHHVMEKMPRKSVLDWIAVDPPERAARVAKITAKNFADSSLAATILDRWGDLEGVRQRFFSAFVSGGWSGNASTHWEQLAALVRAVAEQSKLQGVRRWARDSERELHRMAEHDRKREIEERVRGYN